MANVLITGASRGLGLALTEEYAKKGFSVIACSRKGMNDSLKALQEKFKDLIKVFTMDVTDQKSVDKAADEIRNTVKSIDIIINDAALLGADVNIKFEDIDAENTLNVINTNTLGPFRVTQAFLELLEKGGLKNIVNITSGFGSISCCDRLWPIDYSMSKAALNMQTVLLQHYLKERRIKLLTVDPGSFWSGMGGAQGFYSPNDAACKVITVIDEFGGNIDGPIYLNYKGEVVPY